MTKLNAYETKLLQSHKALLKLAIQDENYPLAEYLTKEIKIIENGSRRNKQ